jgi:exonuclease V
MSDDDYGSDIEFTQELEAVLSAVESQPQPHVVEQIVDQAIDIEDLVRLSPMEEFRTKGYLSVSDLVGTVWCEVQVSPVQSLKVTADVQYD